MENEIQKTEPMSPNQMIQVAIEGNADLEKLEKLLGLQERYEANEARKVFASDFANVQSEIAAVVKTKNNPQTHSKYAGLDDVIEMSKPIYTEQGFSIIFYEGETSVSDNIRVCADVLHKAGHKETYHFDVPLDGVGIKGNANMTKIHGKASSVTYGRRYLLCMIWNIPTQDDDGTTGSKIKDNLPPKPTEQQQEILNSICAILEKKTPKIVLNEKVAAIFLVDAGGYPSKPVLVQEAVEWLLDKKREDEWTATEKTNNLEQAWFNFETEHQDYLADQDGKVEFNKKVFTAKAKEIFGVLLSGKSAQEIVTAIKPETVTVKVKES